MKLTVISNDRQIISSMTKGCRNLPEKYQGLFELAAYDAGFLQDESAMLKMYNDIERADICILDINNDIQYPLLFNIVYTCMRCNGHIIPSDFKSSVGNFLRLGILTIKDITGINPQIDIDSNYLSMIRIVQNIESRGNALSGKFKDFRNYAAICKYIKAGDLESINRLLTLLAEEYGGSFCDKRHIS